MPMRPYTTPYKLLSGYRGRALRHYSTPGSKPSYVLDPVDSQDVLEKDGQPDDFSDFPKNFGLNQHLGIDSELHDTLRSVLWKFHAPIRFAFAYGSGVFPQTGYSKKSGAKPMVDYIFGVSYAQHFHSLNLNEHWDHYSFLRRFGSGVVSHVQKAYGAGVYFNPYVEVNGVMIKYGVVLIDDLCEDLLNWNTLYLAGRMHKPVKILRDHPQVRIANQRNLYSAVRTSLLLLPEKFDERELYTTISKLSYMGDPRMSFGENPRKVENIVTAQLPHFRRLYAPFIDRLPNVSFTSNYDPSDTSASGAASIANLAQDLDPVKRGNMVRRLPSHFRAKLYDRYRVKFRDAASRANDSNRDASSATRHNTPDSRSDSFSNANPQSDSDSNDEADVASTSSVGTQFDRRIASADDLRDQVAHAIRQTVKWPSTSQSVKGILTAGLVKGWRYSLEKLRKARAGAGGAGAGGAGKGSSPESGKQ